ncbi:MAG: thermonuclease family protein [Salinibacter sp.]|uniref:thermonuclease family protein n=1 Tax=Salinibacter sp. TaxID=2065818 RepID=UPI0035D4DD13
MVKGGCGVQKPYGAKARDAAVRYVARTTVGVRVEDVNRYGRVASRITVRGGNLGQMLVQDGFGVALRRVRPPTPRSPPGRSDRSGTQAEPRGHRPARSRCGRSGKPSWSEFGDCSSTQHGSLRRPDGPAGLSSRT